MLSLPADAVILALDPARRTGYAYGRPKDDAPSIGTINFSREFDDPPDVFGRAVNWINHTFEVDDPAALVIELPVPPSSVWGQTNFNTTTVLLGLFAIFSGVAKAHRVPVIEAPIAAWRKYFLDSGKMKGELAKAAALKRCKMLGWNASDHNGAEAAGIWAWGCSQVSPAWVRRVEPLFAGRL
jgi:hypothetical protein